MSDVTTATNVRHPIWRGVQEVAGLWFPQWIAAELGAARMLEAWRPGCRAYRFDIGVVLCFPQPQTLNCDALAGVALCRIHGGLYSAPLTAQELAERPPSELGLVIGAQVVDLRFDQATALDLSEAIDIGAYALHDTYDFRAVRMDLKGPRLEGKSPRALLGDAVPPPSKESEDFLRRLRGERPTHAAPDSLKDRAGTMKEGVLGLMFAALSRVMPASTHGGGTAGSLTARQRPVKPQPWRDRLARLAIASRMAKLIGHRQGAYLRRMMGMFEDGNLEEALRNALPLDGLGQSLGQSFSTPGRRDSLQLSGRMGAATNIALAGELQNHLREMYRNAFAKLDRQGRVDEAVFVLAELLNARQEALDYLVKHGRFAHAAELALGWDMPPALIIRLLMLSGDSRRAVQVARRDGAFSDAVQQLQSSHPELAAELRLEWGHALMQRGDWLGAVDVVWPLPNARDLATQWLLAAEQAGIELSTRALVQRACLLPETIEHYAAKIDALGDPDSRLDERTMLAEALLASKGKSKALKALATAVLPAVAADRASGRNAFSGKDLDKLLRLSGDPVLQADVPRWTTPGTESESPLWKRSSTLSLQAPSAGVHRIHDAAALPGGRHLVALGESGAAVIDAQGRTTQRYAVPAFKLVVADSGQVALAVAPRERVSRIARLDLVTHAMTDLGAMALQFMASRYDGIGWTVVSDDRIVVIDTTKSLRDVLWHVGDLPGPIVAAGFFADKEIFLVRTGQGLQDWSYALPWRRLQGRTDIRLEEDLPSLVHPYGTVLQPQVRVIGSRVELHFRLGTAQRQYVLTDEAPQTEFHCTFMPHRQGLVVGLHESTGSRYFVFWFSAGTIAATIDWPAGAVAVVREQADSLLFHDSEGRLLDISLSRSTARHVSVL